MSSEIAMNELDKGAIERKRLDFIIGGAEKAGTTFLVNVFRQSNSVYMPEREIRYFRDPFYPEKEKPEGLFAGKENVLFGIKHPSYLGRAEVPRRIFEYNPGIKLIFVLRNPVERAISSYLHYLRHGQIPLVHPNIGMRRLIDEQDKVPKYRDILEFGRYYKYLCGYYDLFSAENILVLEYEKLFSQTTEFHRIFEFLGIRPEPVNLLKRSNAGTYDWHESVILFLLSAASYEYDSFMNVVGSKVHPYLAGETAQLRALRKKVEACPIEIMCDVQDLLHDYYQDDVSNLKQSGILAPANW